MPAARWAHAAPTMHKHNTPEIERYSVRGDLHVTPFRCYSESVTSYVERRGEDYMLSGSRVSLASLVSAWKEGLSPESIRDDFPTLRLEQVYGAIAYYLANQPEIDAYLSTLAADFERRRSEEEALSPESTAKLRSTLETAKR